MPRVTPVPSYSWESYGYTESKQRDEEDHPFHSDMAEGFTAGKPEPSVVLDTGGEKMEVEEKQLDCPEPPFSTPNTSDEEKILNEGEKIVEDLGSGVSKLHLRSKLTGAQRRRYRELKEQGAEEWLGSFAYSPRLPCKQDGAARGKGLRDPPQKGVRQRDPRQPLRSLERESLRSPPR